MPRILIVDDDTNLRFALKRILASRVYDVDEAGTGEEALAMIARQPYAVVFLDLRMPGLSGLEVLDRLRKFDSKVPVIIMTAYGTTDTAIEAVKRGAYDFILKPFEVEDIERLTEQAVTAYRLMTRRVDLPAADDAPAAADSDTLVGRSRAMQEVYKEIGRVATSDATVLITGPSGSGKELVARAIYHHSRRSDKPFLAVNCAAIPEGLLESDLFGHERGSFTSAEHRRLGKFERASGGTLFLDEIGDMSAVTQAKILRVLQNGVIERVGGGESIQVDVRIIAATHRDLPALVRQGTFREDLYFRLNVFTIALPSLDQRREDIPFLARHFVERESRRTGHGPINILPETLEKLAAHNWRGNVRELENVIERALIVSTGATLLPESVRFDESGSPPPESGDSGDQAALLDTLFTRLAARAEHDPAESILSVLEHEMLLRALRFTKGNQVHAARLLGISRQTLRNRLADEDSGGTPLSDEGI
ncbi:MAG: sigma-54-dependent Fis family transcriptional regulator [candidate division Zixibacteria bacterium]|nr:sigma-54-dependent Fis family transcriptional regulator [candidate division Zixibacteria bacterium]